MKKYLKKTTGIIIAAALLCSQAVFGFEGEDIAVQDLPDLQEQEAVLEDTYGGQQEPGTEAEDGLIDLSSLIEDDTAPEEELPPVSEETEPEMSSVPGQNSETDPEAVRGEEETEGFDEIIPEDLSEPDEVTEETEALEDAEDDGELIQPETEELADLQSASAADVYKVPASLGEITDISGVFMCYQAQNPTHGVERIAVITGIKNMPADGKITIPLEIKDSRDSYRVMYIADSAFKGKSEIKEVHFEKSADEATITGLSIGSAAFQGCTGIQDIELPNNLFNIGNGVFKGCTGLSSVFVPHILDGTLPVHTVLDHTDSGVAVKIGTNIFQDCGLKTLNENSFDPDLTAVPENLFYGCTSLEYLYLSDSRLANITKVQKNAFYGCTGLKQIELPDSLLEIGNNAFSRCSSSDFTELHLPPNLRALGSSAFNGCSSLKKLIGIPHSLDNTETPSSIGTNVFSGTSIGSSTDGSDITFNKDVLAIPKNLFYGCSSLAYLTLPATIKEIQESAFYKCTGLSSVYCPWNSLIESVGKSAFEGCSCLESVLLPLKLKTIGSSAFKDCRMLVWLYPRQFSASFALEKYHYLETIEANAFENCVCLTKIDFPENLTTIGSSAFNGCNSIESISIPVKLSQSTKLGTNIFNNCNHLNAISKSSFKKGVDSIPQNLFYGANYLRSVELPDGLVSIGNNAFYKCDQWEGSAVLPSTVKSIGNSAFYDCAKLQAITLNDGLETIGTSAFSECKNLEAVSLPGSLTGIGNSAFAGCSVMNKVEIPVFASAQVTVGTDVFKNCPALINSSNFLFANNVTVIPKKMFYGCNSLVEMVIPDSVTEIGAQVFYNCSQLYKLAFPWSVETIASDAFNGSNQLKADRNSGFYGYSTSYAETYAQEKGIPFYSLDYYTGGNPYPPLALEEISLSESSLKLSAGQSSELKVTYKPIKATSDHSIIWSSDDEDIATVDSRGKITAVAEGKTVIHAVSAFKNSITASCALTVIPAPTELTSVVVTPSSMPKMIAGGKMDLAYSYKPENAQYPRVIWSSSDPSVVSVDQEGSISAIKEGTVTVSAAAEADKNVKGTCRVTVINGTMIKTAAMEQTDLIVDKNSSGTVSISADPADATNTDCLWKSDDPAVAAVPGNAVKNCTVRGISPGETMIYGYTTDGSNLRVSRKVIIAEPVTGISLSAGSIGMNLGEAAVLEATVLPENAFDRSVTWSTTNSSVATVDDNGKVTAVGKGTCTIKAVTNRNNKTASCSVRVNVPVSSVTLNVDQLTLKQGNSSRLSATVLPENANDKTVTWSSDRPAVATVSGGTVRGVSAGTAVITAESRDGGHKAYCTVTVTEKDGSTPEDSTVIPDQPGGQNGSGSGNSSGQGTEAEKITISKKPAKFKAKAKKGKAVLSWKALKKKTKKQKKLWKQIKGIEIRYSTDKSFAQYSTIRISKKKTKYTLKRLAKGKTYYVKIRYYDGIGYSSWTGKKSIKVK